MARGKGTWIKLYASFLHSSVNYELSLAQQAIFVKLILLSRDVGSFPGRLSDNDGKPLPVAYLAHECHCTLEEMKETIAICEETDRLKQNGSGVLEVTNWKEYQTEYDRQKPYRKPKENVDPDKYVKGKYGKMVKR